MRTVDTSKQRNILQNIYSSHENHLESGFALKVFNLAKICQDIFYIQYDFVLQTYKIMSTTPFIK